MSPIKTYKELPREIPIAYETDVVVVGGGPGGIGAALASARNGVSTILLEQSNCLGGIGTSGLSNGFMGLDFNVSAGILKEICAELKNRGAVFSETYQHYQVDIEHYKFLLDQMMIKSGVKILYHALGVDVIKDGNSVEGVILECDEGRMAIKAKIVIDGTGYATIAARAGAELIRNESEFIVNGLLIRNIDFNRLLQEKNENPDWVNPQLAFGQPRYRGVNPNGERMPWWPWNFIGGAEAIKKAKERGEITYKDGISICIFAESGPGRALAYIFKNGHGKTWELENRTREEFKLREQEWVTYEFLKKNVPGFENSSIDQTPNDSRAFAVQIVGDYILKGDDAFDGKSFDDSVGVCTWVYDHMEDRRMDVPLFDIPYRCLYSKNIENLMSSGVIISTDRVATFITFGMPSCMVNGQASGTAAALAVKKGVTPRQLDINLLCKTLQEQGHNISKKYLPKEVNAEYDMRFRQKRESMKKERQQAEKRYW
ncbi:MAG: FAD-dependent oxidoreductase [Actinobacteria bacterium]|nr:FAD-dependent oxidoreductase [Actinomycetota bacterium]